MGLDNPLHIAFLLIVLLLVFGARRLPEIGRSIGAGMREFKDSISGQTPMLTQGPQQPQTVPQPAHAQQDAQPVAQQPQPGAQQPQPGAPPAPAASAAPVAPAEAPAEPAAQQR
jgi:sec-independent protein translocase protein TatA